MINKNEKEKINTGISSTLEAAIIMHELYLNLQEAGFSREEALILIASIIKTKE